MPEVGAEHGDVDDRDLVGCEPPISRQFQESKGGIDAAPQIAVGGERRVAAEQRAAQDDRTLLMAMADRVMKATSMIQRCTSPRLSTGGPPDAPYTSLVTRGAPIAALCADLAAYLQPLEPWSDAVRALARASEFEAGDGAAPIDLRLDDLEPSTPAVSAVRAAASSLRWRQNASYTDATFLRRYAYCELVGPVGHAVDHTYSVGLLYLAPGTFYPAHSHPAEEAYHVLAGDGEWWQGDAARSVAPTDAQDSTATRTPGMRVLHPSGVAHAMRSGSTPLLALYIWRGELGVPARLADSADRL